MRIVHTPRVAHAIEELQNLDRALATQANGIPEAGGVDAALLAGARADDFGELRDAAAIIEQIGYQLVKAALRDLLAQRRAHPILRLAHGGGEVADPGRIEASGADQRLQFAQQCLIVVGKNYHVLRQTQPRAAAQQQTLVGELIDQRPPQCGWHIREADAPQPRRIGPGFIREPGMKAAERAECAFAQRLPVRRQQHKALIAGLDGECRRGQPQLLRRATGQAHEIGRVQAVTRLLEQRRDTFPGEHPLESCEEPATFGRAAPARRCARIEHGSAADGVPTLRIADDEAVAGRGSERRIENQLHPRGFAGREARRFQQHDVSHAVQRRQMHVQRRPRRYARRACGQQLQTHIEARAG
ncbi:MAG TPA: hypothetical protein VK803_10360 [Steroidobacteraceae bacterium]|nr:hypothetical protein [Steroidobacteraceae bacterium]